MRKLMLTVFGLLAVIAFVSSAQAQMRYRVAPYAYGYPYRADPAVNKFIPSSLRSIGQLSNFMRVTPAGCRARAGRPSTDRS